MTITRANGQQACAMWWRIVKVFCSSTKAVMAGLVPAIHDLLSVAQAVDTRDERRHDAAYINPSYKSSHSGLSAWMSRTFHARGQCLTVRSRWIAKRMSSYRSQ